MVEQNRSEEPCRRLLLPMKRELMLQTAKQCREPCDAGGPAGDSSEPRVATSGRLRNIMEDEQPINVSARQCEVSRWASFRKKKNKMK
jgi:hypothetical protein